VELPNDKQVAIICGSGYRSSIAGSMLQAQGHEKVGNVSGGMTAFADGRAQ
jgi:hydroxyacylglutathione hydrolase